MPSDITKQGVQGLRGLPSLAELERERRAVLTGSTGYAPKPVPGYQSYGAGTPMGDYGTSQYDEPFLSAPLTAGQIQDTRYENQPWYDVFANGVGKMLGTAATTFVSSLVGIPAGLATAATEGRWSGLWDNDVTNALSSVDDWMEKNMTNYQSQEQQQDPHFRLGDMNWWADNVIKNVGFTLGAAASGAVGAGALGLMSRALNMVNNVSKGVKIGNQIASALFSATGEGMIEAKQGVEERNKLKLQQLDDEFNPQYGILDDELQQATQEYYLERTGLPNDPAYARYRQKQEEIVARRQQLDERKQAAQQEIEDTGRQMGNAILLGNQVFLTLGNIIEFGKGLTKSYDRARHMAEVSSKVKKPSFVGASRVSDDITKGYKIYGKNLGRGVAALKNTITEGQEEMSQQWISSAATNYYDRKDVNDYWRARLNQDATKDVIDGSYDFGEAISKGFKDSYGTAAQWEQFLIGALTGATGVAMPTKVFNQDKSKSVWNPARYFSWEGGAVDDVRQFNKEYRQYEDNIKDLNTVLSKGDLKDRIQRLSAHTVFQQDKEYAAEKNDRKAWGDADDKQAIVDIQAFLRAGKLDDLRAIYADMAGNMTDADIDGIIDKTSYEVSEEEDQKNHDKLMDDDIAATQKSLDEATKELSGIADPSSASDPASAVELSMRRGKLEAEINNLNEKINSLKEEKQNYQKKRRFYGPFVTEDGNHIKTREEIRREIRNNVDELNRKLDSYLDSVAAVQKDTGGKLTKEQEDNLAYLHNLGKESIYRSNNTITNLRGKLPKTMVVKTNKTPEELSRQYITSDLVFSKNDTTKDGYVEVDTSKMTDTAFANFFMDTIISGDNIGDEDAASEVIEELEAQKKDKDLSKEEQEKNRKEREKAREEKKKNANEKVKKDREDQLRENEKRIRDAFVRDLMDNQGQTLEQALHSKEYDQLISDINDAIDLRSQANSYYKTLSEYMSNPSKVDQDMQKEENKAQEEKKNKDIDASSLQDLMKKSNVDLLSIINGAKNKKNKKGNAAKAALGLKELQKGAEEELAKKVNDKVISDETREDAERLLNTVIGNYINAFDEKEEEIKLPSDLLNKILNSESEGMIDPMSLLDSITRQQAESGSISSEDLAAADLELRHARARDALRGIEEDVFDRLARLSKKMDLGKIVDNMNASEQQQIEKEKKAAQQVAQKVLNQEHLKETGGQAGEKSEQIKSTVVTILSSTEEIERSKSIGSGEDETLDTDMEDGTQGKNTPKDDSDNKWHPWMTSTSEVGHFSNEPYQPSPGDPDGAFKKKRYDVIRQKLIDLGAYTALKQGAAKEDMVVGFKVFEDVNTASGDFVIFITDEHGNVIGDVPSNDKRLGTANRDIKMDAFYAAVKEEWDKATPEERKNGMQSKYTSHLDHVLVGKVLYQQDRQTVSDLMAKSNGKPLFAIKTRMGMHTGRNNEGNAIVDEVHLPKTGNPGQPYVLIPTPKIHSGEGPFKYYAVPIKTMTVGEAIRNNTTFAKVLRELLENIQDYNVDRGIGISDSQAAQLLETLLAVANVHVNLSQGSDSKKGLGIHITTFDRKEKTEKHNSWAIYEGSRENMDIDKIMEALSRFSINVSASFINGNVNYYESLLKVDGNPVDYNAMIAEVSNTNAAVPETVNDWFTIRPLVSDGNTLKEVAEKDKKTEWEDIESGRYKEFNLSIKGKQRKWKVELGTWRVLDENEREITRTDNTHTKEEWEAAKQVAAEVWGIVYMKSKDAPYAVMVGGESFIYVPQTRTFKTYEELESDPEYNFSKLKNGEHVSAAGQYYMLERWMNEVATNKELTSLMMKEREEIRQRVTGPQSGETEISAQQVGQSMVSHLQEMGVNAELVDDATKAAEGIDDAQLLAIGEQGARNLDLAEEATARMDNLSVANEMENAGKDALAIKLATGWERGADNKWRYEIPDLVLNAGLLHILINEEKPVTLAKLIRGYYNHKDKNAETLFNAYSKIKNAKVIFSRAYQKSRRGSYNPDSNTITIYPAAFGIFGRKFIDEGVRKSIEETLVHEIQHAIQEIEGFQSGTNLEEAEESLRDLKDRKMSEWNNLIKQLGNIKENYRKSDPTVKKFFEQEYKSVFAGLGADVSEEELNDLRNYYQNLINNDAKAQEIIKRLKLLQEQDRKINSNFDDFVYSLYYRAAGEAEARAISARHLMTDEERKNTLLTDTIYNDVAKKDLRFLKTASEALDATSQSLSAEMQEIKTKAIADGTFMKAPNGKPTNLTERQWLQVRTKNFINWFGDWINDPANASKVVDENGEPLVVYTGVPVKGLTEFSLETENRSSLTDILKKGIYFSNNKKVAEEYIIGKPIYKTTDKVNEQQAKKINTVYRSGELGLKDEVSEYVGLPYNIIEEYVDSHINEVTGELDVVSFPKGEVIPAFLNIKNPAVIKHDGSTIAHLSKENRDIINNNNEGAIIENVNERTNYTGEADFDLIGTDYIVFNPNQIKSAVANSGKFSNENPDINMLKVNGKILGFEYNGKLYLQKDAIDPNLPMHEYTHLWDKVVKEVDPRLWARGKKLMQTDAKDLWNDIAESEDYGKRWEKEGKSKEEIEDLIASEVHARLTGDSFEKTQKKYNKSTFAQIREWMLDVLKALAKTFGMSNSQVDALTLQDWTRLTLRDFLNKSVTMQTLQQFRESQNENQKDHTKDMENTLAKMEEDSEKYTLVRWDDEQGVYVEDSRNGEYYRHENGTIHARVSNINAADEDVIKANEEADFPKIKGPSFIPSTGAGNAVDRFIRDSFIGGDPLYGMNLGNPETRKEALQVAGAIYDRLSPANIAWKEGADLILAVHQMLWDMNRDETVGEWEINSAGIVAEGMVRFDKNNIVNVAGTIDLLLYNKKRGEGIIVDMKTHRANIYKRNGDLKEDAKTKATVAHWRAQQTMYKQFLENKYDKMKIVAIKIFPMTVSYSTNYSEASYKITDAGILTSNGIPVNVIPKFDGKLINLVPKDHVNYTIGQLPESVKRIMPGLNPILSKPREAKIPVKEALTEMRDRVPDGRKLAEFIKEEYKDSREVQLLVSNLESNKGSQNPILMTAKSQDLLLNALDSNALEKAVTEAKALKENVIIDIPAENPQSSREQDIEAMFDSGVLDIDYRDMFDSLSDEVKDKIINSSDAADTFNDMARNGDDAEDISDAIGGMPGIRHKKALAIPYKVLDMDKELKWLSRVLPQLSTSERLQLVKGLIKCSDGSDDFGRLQNSIILIGTQAGEGTVFHEAFHAVVQLLLTDEEIDRLYDAAKKRWGDLNPVVLEEKLADEFEYHIAGMEYEEGVIRRFFRKLWEAIKALVGNKSYIDTLFRDINNGVYAGREFRDDRNNAFSEIRKEQREHTKDYAFLAKEDRDRIKEADIDSDVYDQMTKDQKEYMLHCVL